VKGYAAHCHVEAVVTCNSGKAGVERQPLENTYSFDVIVLLKSSRCVRMDSRASDTPCNRRQCRNPRQRVNDPNDVPRSMTGQLLQPSHHLCPLHIDANQSYFTWISIKVSHNYGSPQCHCSPLAAAGIQDLVLIWLQKWQSSGLRWYLSWSMHNRRGP
jgi:hypothetical protein